MPRRLALLVLLAALSTPGCASLVLRDTDSIEVKAGKVAARTVLVFPTLLLSEIWITNAKHELERELEREDARLESEEADRRYREDMDAAVGRMTMDEAVSKLGPPTSVYEGTEIIVAEWSRRSSGAVALPVGGMVMALPLHRGRDLRLTFDRESRLLRQWSDTRF